MKAKSTLRKTPRPANVNPTVWNVLKKVADEIWSNYERGSKWNRQVLVSCKEFYEMLLDENGELILKSPELVRFSQNGHIKTWANELLLDGLNLMGADEYDLAMEKFDLHLLISPKSALVNAKMGECLLQKGEYLKGLKYLNTAIELNNRESEYFVLRAQCFSFLDRDEKAMNDLNFALLLNKRNARAYAHRGTLHLAQGQDKEAIQDLKKAVEFNPASEEFMRLLARAYVSLRQYPKAYKTLQEVLAQNPFNAECLFLIAKVRLEFGVEEYKAEDELLMARSLGNPNAEKLLLDYFSPFKKLDWGKAA